VHPLQQHAMNEQQQQQQQMALCDRLITEPGDAGP
jgi:hypothetical protein